MLIFFSFKGNVTNYWKIERIFRPKWTQKIAQFKGIIKKKLLFNSN